MDRKAIVIFLTVVLMLSILILALPVASVTAEKVSVSIWTDKADYSPGETVTIYGSGFKARATVTITIERPDSTIDTVYATTDRYGNFTCTYKLDGILGTYIVTATDGKNIASTTFTDAAVDQDFYGWKLSSRTPGYPNWPGGWTKGDLGKNWREGDWVSYVLVLNGYGGTVLPSLNIVFDFYISTKDGIFVDLVRNFHYMIRDPYPGSGEPTDITPANFQIKMTPFTPQVINRPFPVGTPDSQTNPPGFAYWQLTPNPVFDSPIPAGKSVVIYFEAHLAPSLIWTNGLEAMYNTAPFNAWGGDRYAGWTAKHGGAGYTSGSNPQFRLDGQGIGQKTIPIPIPPLATGEIRGTKYHDLDADGIRDPGEPGLGGWTINLEATFDSITFTATTTTASDGTYAFTGLAPGIEYTISEVQQAGWTQSAPTPVPPGTYKVTLDEGQIVTGKDFGNYKPGRIIVRKYTVPAGSTQNFEFDPSWSTVKFFLTDGDEYNSGPLAPGTYSVSEIIPTGWDLTSVTKNGTAFTNGGSIVLCSGQTWIIVYTNTQRGKIIVDKVTVPSEDAQSFDFAVTGPGGYSQSFSLTDAASPWDSGWIKPGTYAVSETVPEGWDLTSAVCSDGSPVGNIDLSPGETVTVTFTDTKRGKIIVDKITDPSGHSEKFTFNPSWTSSFQLDDDDIPWDSGWLTPGTYSVTEVVPAGWALTSVTKNSVPFTNGGNIALGAGETVYINFTNFKLGIKGGYKYEDKTGNGPSSDDTPLSSWTINLWSAGADGVFGTADDVLEDTKTTGANGYYEFVDLKAGTYRVNEAFTTSWTQTYPTNGYYEFTVTGGFEDRDNNFYNFHNVEIKVCKVEDADGNLATTGDQTPKSGWEVKLYKDDVLISTVTTGADGCYTWTDLGPGSYKVVETIPAGWTSLDASTEHDFGVVQSGGSYSWTFHNFKNVEITVWKFEDLTGDGKTSDDTPIGGWTVRLYKDGVLTDTKTTAADGHYTWSNLGPGSYKVDEVVPACWTPTSATSNDFGVVQSGQSYSFTFTNFKLVTITADKWDDLNGDGVKDPDEPEISGWKLTITCPNGTTNTMDSPASWTVRHGGTYTITEELQTGWVHTTPSSVDVLVQSGSTPATVWFGNFKLGKISGYKWNDLNGDGDWDADEPALSGWTITLSGSISGMTVTDENGYYEFTGLTAGVYTVSETLQAGWTQTYPSAPGTHKVQISSGLDATNINFGNQMPLVYCWETAYAYGGSYANPFTKYGFSNWGWTNGPISEGTYTWDIYAGAGLNDLSKGTKVGTVTIVYSGGTLSWEITLDSPYILENAEHKEEVHVYVGYDPLPTYKKGKTNVPTVAPGQYPYKGSTGSVSGLTKSVYVIIHAIVGIPCQQTP